MDYKINFDSYDVSPAAAPPKIYIDSCLIDYSHYDFLIKCLNETGFSNFRLDLKYRATRDGDRNFHSICNGIPNNICIIKAKETGALFGGYTKNVWSSNGTYANDNKAFLFSLNKLKKLTVQKPCWATYNVEKVYNIVYGYPDDIKIYEGFLGSSKNLSKLGETYNDPNANLDPNYLVDAKNFTVEEVEFFQIV